MTTTRWKVIEKKGLFSIVDEAQTAYFGQTHRKDYAAQIVREHNEYESLKSDRELLVHMTIERDAFLKYNAAMVEALDQLQKYVGTRDANGNEIKFILKAQAALQLARGEL